MNTINVIKIPAFYKACFAIGPVTFFSMFCMVLLLHPGEGTAQRKQETTSVNVQPATARRDGSHDFDVEIGTWKTHLKRLRQPLTGSSSWVEYEGRTIVRKVWDGRANLVELVADGPAGHFEGLSLRLYNAESAQWSLNFSSINSGVLAIPTMGEFNNGRGEFYNQETLNGRAILVRFIISHVTPDLCQFEQAFSDDGGKSWEVNWMVTDTRMKDAPEK
jgi:hypothetical protein